MSSETKEYLSVHYQEEDLLLQAQWLRHVSSEEYRAGVALIKEGILENKASFLLIDSRRISNVPFADQQWIKREIAPDLVSSGLQKLARVLTEDVFNYISFENLLQTINEDRQARVEVAQFTSVEAALAWLQME